MPLGAARLPARRDERKNEVMSFENLGLSDVVLKAVKDAGYENATDVQAQAIPAAIATRT